MNKIWLNFFQSIYHFCLLYERSKSPVYLSGDSLYVLFFLLQLFLHFYSPIKNGAIKILADHLISLKTLTISTLFHHLRELNMELIAFFFLLEEYFYFFILTVNTDGEIWLSFAAKACVYFFYESTQCALLAYFWCIS